MNETSVTAEIHKLIDGKIAAGVIVHADWIAAEILQIKDKIQGDDLPFYRVCAHRDILRIARRAIGRYQADDMTPAQLVMDGFIHLSRAYPITREGAVVLVPVNLCTDEELLARAAQLDEMARGCRAHGREIRDYVAARRGALGEVA